MPKSIINRLIALKHLQALQRHNNLLIVWYHSNKLLFQEESDKIEQEYKIERVALEKKYRELKAPQWEKRQQVVNGEVEVEALVKEDVVVGKLSFRVHDDVSIFIWHNLCNERSNSRLQFLESL